MADTADVGQSQSDMHVSTFRNPLTESTDTEFTETVLRLGPVQPKGNVFKGTAIVVANRLKTLKFQESWYEGRPWLEYSVHADAACCFYCRVFKPKVNGQYTSVNTALT